MTVCHVIQSITEGEIDAETAHEIGVRLAEEMFGGKFEVIVATHLNTEHVHNHLIVNSFSFADGKKYEGTRTNYHRLRDIPGNLCCEYGLSVVGNPQRGQRQWRITSGGTRRTVREQFGTISVKPSTLHSRLGESPAVSESNGSDGLHYRPIGQVCKDQAGGC